MLLVHKAESKYTHMGHFTDFMRGNPNRIFGTLYLFRLFAFFSEFSILLSAAPSQPCRYGWALWGGGVRGGGGGSGDCSIGRKDFPAPFFNPPSTSHKSLGRAVLLFVCSLLEKDKDNVNQNLAKVL